MRFDPDDTPTTGRKQPTVEHVIRDLRRGDGVRAEWAPVAVGELLRARLVHVNRGGWVNLLDRRPTTRSGRAVCPFSNARDRERRIVAMLPTTVDAIAAEIGMTPSGVMKALVRAGAVRVGLMNPPPRGGRWRVIWGLPFPSGSDRVGRTLGEST